MSLQPIEASRRSLADEAYNRITEAMLHGSLPPGSRLVMDTLAEDLRISRTPVRDALKRMEQEHLIEPTGRRGFVVRHLDEDEIRETYEAREAIEGFAARLAALNPAAGRLVSDAVELAVTYDLGTVLGSYQANRLVHRAVMEAAGNRILLEQFDSLWSRGSAHRIYADCFRAPDSAALVRHKHGPIVAALDRQDPDAAEEAMIGHLRSGFHDYTGHTARTAALGRAGDVPAP